MTVDWGCRDFTPLQWFNYYDKLPRGKKNRVSSNTNTRRQFFLDQHHKEQEEDKTGNNTNLFSRTRGDRKPSSGTAMLLHIPADCDPLAPSYFS